MKPWEFTKLSEDEERAWKDVLATKSGRKVLTWVVYDLAKVESTTFTGSSQTFYLEGRRSIGVELLRVIDQCAPDDRVRMIEEMLHEELTERRRQELEDAVRREDNTNE